MQGVGSEDFIVHYEVILYAEVSGNVSGIYPYVLLPGLYKSSKGTYYLYHDSF